MVENKQFKIRRSELGPREPLVDSVERVVGPNALRWYIGDVAGDEILVEATMAVEPQPRFEAPTSARCYPGRTAVLSIIPTGVGCSIGGYAGDAAPATNLLASTVDYLVTNPNALNASDFIGAVKPNILYTDGRSIDLFSGGLVELQLPYSNKLGLIIEKSDSNSLDVVFNVINTVRAVHGIDVRDYVITKEPIGGRSLTNKSGAIVGVIDNPHVLFDACDKLIRNGVNAIAVTTNIQDLPLDGYARHFEGDYPNPVGGVEAVISFSITNKYRVPAAHAPLTNVRQLSLKHNVVDARSAGEMVSASGLACVLIGLRSAPRIEESPKGPVKDVINRNNLLAVVAPASCLGGIPVLYAIKNDIPVIAVQDNRTILDVTKLKLNLSNVIEVRNYAEAAGLLLALKEGIALESVYRPLKTLRPETYRCHAGEQA